MSVESDVADTQQPAAPPATMTQQPINQTQLPPEKKPRSIEIVLISIAAAIGLFFTTAVVYGVFIGFDDAVTELKKEDQGQAQITENEEKNKETALDEVNRDKFLAIPDLGVSIADPDKRGLLLSSESYKDVTGNNRSVYYITTLDSKFEECGRVLQIGELAGPEEYSPPSETESGDESAQKTIDAKVYFVIKTVGSEIDDSCRGNAEFNTFVTDLQAYVLQNMDKSLTQ